MFFIGKGKKEEDFEIHKKEDSVQKKRHYRNNNKDDDTSGSDSETDHARRVSCLKIINVFCLSLTTHESKSCKMLNLPHLETFSDFIKSLIC